MTQGHETLCNALEHHLPMMGDIPQDAPAAPVKATGCFVSPLSVDLGTVPSHTASKPDPWTSQRSYELTNSL